MDLRINFKTNKEVSLKLVEQEKNIDLLTVTLDIHFDTVLVTAVDKLLKRNRIDPLFLNIIVVEGEVDDSSVAYHIALAVASALKSK